MFLQRAGARVHHQELPRALAERLPVWGKELGAVPWWAKGAASGVSMGATARLGQGCSKGRDCGGDGRAGRILPAGTLAWDGTGVWPVGPFSPLGSDSRLRKARSKCILRP